MFLLLTYETGQKIIHTTEIHFVTYHGKIHEFKPMIKVQWKFVSAHL